MKRCIGIGAAILVAGGLSDVIQGLLLTWMYEPSPYTSQQLVLPGIVGHGLTAILAVLIIYGAGKFRNGTTDAQRYSENVQ